MLRHALIALTLLAAAPLTAGTERLIPAQFFSKLSIDDVPGLRKRAEAGDMAAQVLLWQAYMKKPRHGAPPWASTDQFPSRAEFEAALRAAAEQGDSDSAALLTSFLLSGQSMARDPREAQVMLALRHKTSEFQRRGVYAGVLAEAIVAADDATPEELAEAQSLTQEALSLGDKPAIRLHARLVAQTDPAAARALLEAALPGNPDASLPLAQMLLTGEGGPRDVARAERLLVADRSPEARAERARQHLDGGAFPRMPLRAMALMEDQAARDVTTRQTLARMLITYQTRIPSADKLFYRMQEDADTGVPGAALTLALLLRENREGFRNEKFWFDMVYRFADTDPRIAVLKAGITGRWASNSDTEANRKLFARQTVEAIDRLEKQGVREAFTLHGRLIQMGGAYRQDVAGALAYLAKGAEMGDPEAMVLLGDAIEDGKGTPKDRRAALEWYRRAAALGDPDARAKVAFRFRFDGFEKQMTLREGLSEQIVLFADGLSGSALTTLSGVFSSPRLRDFTDAEVATAILDGLRLAPAAVDEDNLIALTRQVPQGYWAMIEQLMVDNALMPGPAQGYMGPEARDALRQCVYAVGPP